MNNKIILRKTTSAIFLAVILVIGTITLSNPSFMMADAQPELYYGMDDRNSDYKQDYGMDRYDKKSYTDSYESNYGNSYEQESYGKDYDKSKDGISDLLKKLKCNNINVNINGVGINATGPDAANDSSLPVTDAVASQGYGENHGYKKSDNGFKFVCINNNNNTVIVGNGTTTPEPLTCEECFTENIIDELQLTNFTGTLVVYTEFGDLEGLCEFLSDPSFTNNEKIAQLSLIFSRTLIPTDVRLSILECLDERGIINVGSGGDRPNR